MLIALTLCVQVFVWHADSVIDREIGAIHYLRNRKPNVIGGHQFNVPHPYDYVLRKLSGELKNAKGWKLEKRPAHMEGSLQPAIATFVKGRLEVLVLDLTGSNFGKKSTEISFKLNAP